MPKDPDMLEPDNDEDLQPDHDESLNPNVAPQDEKASTLDAPEGENDNGGT